MVGGRIVVSDTCVPYRKNHQGRVEDTGDRLVPLYPEHNSGVPCFRGANAVTAWLLVFKLRNLV
jgi:hypothetical protein